MKAWLLGGTSIPVGAALFDMTSYGGEIVSDLFGDDRYFASASEFSTAQAAAIEERAASYREAGWSEVVILPTGEPFQTWEHERTSKRKGGKVFISTSQRGDVTFNEGFLTSKEARRLAKGESLAKPVRPEISAPLQNYIDLHRHAAVRAEVTGQPAVALRLMVAHAIVGSTLFRVTAEPQRAHSDAIAESVETCASETAFDANRRAALDLIGFDAEAPTLTGGYDGDHGVAGLFVRLLELTDAAVLDILAIVMAEALESGSATVELLGMHLGIDMPKLWQADDALLDLIKDREVLDGILGEVAGESVASANASATGKVKRRIIRDRLKGEGGREKVEGWVPRWMRFPPAAYTERGGVGSVGRAEQVAILIASEPEPEAPAEIDLQQAA